MVARPRHDRFLDHLLACKAPDTATVDYEFGGHRLWASSGHLGRRRLLITGDERLISV